jgi:hypothetical protein
MIARPVSPPLDPIGTAATEVDRVPPLRWREVGVAAVAVAVLLVVELVASHPRAAFTSGFWLDEYFTYLIATDPSPSHALEGLRSGIDATPPVYHALLAVVRRALPGVDARACFRGCSVVGMGLTLLALYAGLRAGFSRLPAATAVLAFIAHPLALRYTLEARSYSMLLAGIAGLAWGLRVPGWPGIALRVASAAVACSVQYLGIIPVAGVLTAELLFGPGAFRTRLRRILPGPLGACALIPLLPLLLHQKQTFGESWVDPFSPRNLVYVLAELFYPLPLLAVLVAWWASRLLGHRPFTPPERLRAIVPLAALIGVPAVIAAYSAVGDSLLVDRYMFATLLAIPALLASAIAETDRRLTTVVALGCLGLSVLLMRANVQRMEIEEQWFQRAADLARQPGADYALVFDSRHEAYPTWFAAPDLRARIGFLDLSTVDPATLYPIVRYEQRLHRQTAHVYDLPPTWDLATLRAKGRFRFLGNPMSLAALRRVLPLREVDPDLHIFEPLPH